MRKPLIALLALLLVLLVPGTALAKTRTDRVISDPRILESSGLAPSLLHDGVLWTHNDSGNPNQIYAIAKNGSTAAAVTIAGEDARDWEAITSWRDADGRALIAIGDIGDNNAKHDYVRIAIIREPENLTDMTVQPIRVLRLTYPGGPRDAEALLADPRTGRLYVVSKTLFGSEVFVVPTQVWPGGTGVSRITRMTRVARTGAALVTDGAFLPDGNMLLRGYGNQSVIAAPETAEDGSLDTLASQALPDQEQGESIAVVDDGAYALIGSEGEDQPVLRVRVPSYAVETAAPTSSSAETTSGTTETLRTLTGDDNRLRLLIGAGGAVVVMVVLFSAAIMLRPSHSRRRRR
ncbi:hypothetical protein GCM10022223_57170 [Kineosporia mesophila]|uniref:WD40 repeat domain-containing protein n=1 Tax=Kineosporia mesophila TaxID=566012 RepID=A0ABP7AGE0_9ACTN|nr:hypothetical protein [Kineosporia mesophila]MCD5350914.1 hypothetical protein [Kineosporia mesophila]